VVQWNFQTLGLIDLAGSRYFQVEALHDCLIRNGDHTEWMGTLDLDEYIVLQSSNESLPAYLTRKYNRLRIGSLTFWSLFFCTQNSTGFSPEESNQTRLVIERFTRRSISFFRDGREKYLYRPSHVIFLSIHYPLTAYSPIEPPRTEIIMAHYHSMNRFRTVAECATAASVNDTTVRDRFADRLRLNLEKRKRERI
jgi:hypothetical protein